MYRTEDISEHLYGNKDLIRLQECNDSGIHKEVQQLEAAVHGNETETMSRRPLESALSLQPHGQMVLSVSPRDITDRARDMSGTSHVIASVQMTNQSSQRKNARVAISRSFHS